jgi:hypothetical protein
MLGSITPLAQRGGHSRYLETLLALIVGSVIGAVIVGWILGTLGHLVFGGGPSTVRWVAIGVILLVAGSLDLGLLSSSVPTYRRQVNENWLVAYRGWVTGLGFGIQLGTGVATIVSTAGVYALLAIEFLGASAAGGAAIGFAYGLARGLISLGSSRVRTAADLNAMTRGIERWRAPVAAITGICLIGGGAIVLVFSSIVS